MKRQSLKRPIDDRQPDERVRRTRERLGMALLTLVQEKPYHRIAIKEVLQRAGVGRSTFYVHYRDKNDLLLSELEMFLEMMSTDLSNRREKSQRVAPVEEMFAHIREQTVLYRALEKADRLNDFFDLAQGYFSRGIAQRLVECGNLADLPARELDARASAIAGSMLSLLRWWLDRGAKESPRALDQMFHGMVWKGLR